MELPGLQKVFIDQLLDECALGRSFSDIEIIQNVYTMLAAVRQTCFISNRCLPYYISIQLGERNYCSIHFLRLSTPCYLSGYPGESLRWNHVLIVGRYPSSHDRNFGRTHLYGSLLEGMSSLVSCGSVHCPRIHRIDRTRRSLLSEKICIYLQLLCPTSKFRRLGNW